VPDVERFGYTTLKELRALRCYPGEKRVAQGPVAVLECLQEIPCDPCGGACPAKAIKVPELTGLPVLDESLCVGCGACVAACPGQAIFVLDGAYGEDEGTVTFPYEYLPLPEKDAVLPATDRQGRVVCSARVVAVESVARFNKTALVTVAVPKRWMHEVRLIQMRKDGPLDEL
jgi:Fe-S-cluster-containing hydrogenase component 2